MKKINKQIPAIVAAFIITCLVAASMLFIGGEALANTNTVPTLNSPSAAKSTTGNSSSVDPATTAQLQNLVSQYQQREQQYQAQIQQANQQLQQTTQQLQQYQQLIQALQQRGIIQIGSDGTIYIPRGGFGDFH